VLMILFVQESLGGWASPSVAIPSMKHYFYETLFRYL